MGLMGFRHAAGGEWGRGLRIQGKLNLVEANTQGSNEDHPHFDCRHRADFCSGPSLTYASRKESQSALEYRRCTGLTRAGPGAGLLFGL